MFSLPFNRRFPATPHEQTAWLHQRPIKICWTDGAERAFSGLTHPLYVELQLYFSCLIKKQILFHSAAPEQPFDRIHEKLYLCFSPVTSVACTLEEGKHGQPTQPVETTAVEKMLPSILMLDFRRGSWRGEYLFI